MTTTVHTKSIQDAQKKIRNRRIRSTVIRYVVLILVGIIMYELTKDEKYLKFADDFDGWFVQEDGSIRTYDPEEKNLDNLNAARNLYTLYKLTGKEKYRKAMDTARHQLEIQPRTKAGNFWHKQIYPNQVWLDGLYMAQPFFMFSEHPGE